MDYGTIQVHRLYTTLVQGRPLSTPIFPSTPRVVRSTFCTWRRFWTRAAKESRMLCTWRWCKAKGAICNLWGGRSTCSCWSSKAGSSREVYMLLRVEQRPSIRLYHAYQEEVFTAKLSTFALISVAEANVSVVQPVISSALYRILDPIDRCSTDVRRALLVTDMSAFVINYRNVRRRNAFFSSDIQSTIVVLYLTSMCDRCCKRKNRRNFLDGWPVELAEDVEIDVFWRDKTRKCLGVILSNQSCNIR